MKRMFILVAAMSATACSKPVPMTVEAKILTNGFASYVAALTWDEVCNGTDSKSRYDFKKSENVMLMGNQQMFAARLGGLWHIEHPEKSVDEGVKALMNVQQKIETAAREKLKSEGCQGETATRSAKAYLLYTKAHPAQTMAMIDKTIIEQGGKVTSPEEVEAAGKPPAATADAAR